MKILRTKIKLYLYLRPTVMHEEDGSDSFLFRKGFILKMGIWRFEDNSRTFLWILWEDEQGYDLCSKEKKLELHYVLGHSLGLYWQCTVLFIPRFPLILSIQKGSTYSEVRVSSLLNKDHILVCSPTIFRGPS